MIGNDWDLHLKQEFKKEYYKNLTTFLKEQRKTKTIFPSGDDVFNALKLTSFADVKVVIIGQDPYHAEGQAHGLSFSVKREFRKLPPSLKNIYKELQSDLKVSPPDHGNLENWSKQGVLLLNNVLTVEKGKPGSHRKKGWEEFTDFIIKELNNKKENLVFILWGNDAKKKASIVDREKHFIIESAHPSPFSCKNFYGTKPFSKTNNFLLTKDLKPIKWSLF